MASGYKFPIRDSAGNATGTSVNFEDMFVGKDTWVGDGLWSWGRNSRAGGALTTTVSSPVQIGSLTNWKQVAVEFYLGCATKTDGTLWLWGDNSYGQLGQSNTTSTTSPVQVGTLTNWKQVDCSAVHVSAIKTDGTLWLWGQNTYGQLGGGATRSSPVQVGSLTDWKRVSNGYYYTTAIKNDGTLWAWGHNGSGQLGLGGAGGQLNSPTQVGTLTNWKQVSAAGQSGVTAAIKTDGTLWTWGSNSNGQLGLNDTTHRSSPVQVGSLTNWKYVSTSMVISCAAIKTDGTLWTWGYNSSGQLGLGDQTHRSSPVQVGSLTNWKYHAGGNSMSIGIKTDGTLWTWGYNGDGQLGLGNTNNYSSPVQVGTLTNWKQVDSTFNTSYGHYTMAVKSSD